MSRLSRHRRHRCRQRHRNRRADGADRPSISQARVPKPQLPRRRIPMAASLTAVRHPKTVSHAEWIEARKAVSGQGEGIHPPARRAQPPAPRTTLGTRREAVCIRRPARQQDACRSVRRSQPAHGVSLHVRPGMERRLSQLLLPGRSLRRHDHSSRPSRRDLRRGLPRSLPADRRLQKAHGLAVSLGVVVRLRFQLRLPRLADRAGKVQREGRL